MTFLISSHILTELSLIATKYGIISKGKLIKEITSKELHNECSKTTLISSDTPEKLLETVKNSITNECEITTDGVKILGNLDLTALLAAIISSKIKITSVNCSETSFEDYYLSVIGGVGK